MEGLIVILLVVCIILLVRNNKPNENTAPTQRQTAADDSERKARHAQTQLIGGSRFVESYGALLQTLRHNENFMRFIMLLHTELNGEEFTNTKAANRKIANKFYYGNINELYPEVKQIAEAVKQYGAQASAHISIYYAMFILK